MYSDQLTIEIDLPPHAPSIFQQYSRFPKANINEVRKEHLGIDIIAPEGTPVLAAASGRVVRSNSEPIYGNTVIIEHGTDSTGKKMQTIYKHLYRRDVKEGEQVKRGQKIGGLGRTGFLSSGILHVHFEVLQQQENGRFVQLDPSLYWAGGVGKVVCFSSSGFWPERPFKITYPVVCKAR